MKREDLFLAIGQVEESRLARCENQAPSGLVCMEGNEMEMNTKKRPTGRTLRNLLVAAVVVALLAVTAVAAPAAYEGITGAWRTEEWEFYAPTDANGNSPVHKLQYYEVDIQLDEDAPEEIETYYLPQMPEEYTQFFGNLYGGIEELRRTSMYCSWSDEEAINSVAFCQTSKYRLDRGDKSVPLHGDNSEVRQTELGGVDGILILDPDATGDFQKYFFWTDGEYLFKMKFAWHITEEEMAEIISSIYVVEDIRPYLISYCESEEYLEELLN